jgi:tetratricopeptide (TPR) repeat protein
VRLADEAILTPVKDLIAAGQLIEAQRALAHLNQSDPEVRYFAAIIHYQLHEYEQAATEAEIAVRSEKEGTSAWLERVALAGRSYYLAGRSEKAVAWLERARLAGDRRNESLYMLGNAYLQIRDFASAMATFAALFGNPPGSAAAHLITAHMMVARNIGDEARKEAGRALELDPSISGAHFLIGEIALQSGDISSAIAELRKEIASNPTLPMAYYGLGQAYARGSEWTQAIRFLEQSILLDPNFSDPYSLLGKSYFKQGDLSKAEGILRRAIAINPSDSSAYYLLGQVLLQEGHAVEGRKMLDRSRQLREAKH